LYKYTSHHRHWFISIYIQLMPATKIVCLCMSDVQFSQLDVRHEPQSDLHIACHSSAQSNWRMTRRSRDLSNPSCPHNMSGMRGRAREPRRHCQTPTRSQCLTQTKIISVPQRAKSPPERKYPAEGATPAAAPIDVREVNWSRLAGWMLGGHGESGQGKRTHTKNGGIKIGLPLVQMRCLHIHRQVP
jgi:hypothetical protein